MTSLPVEIKVVNPLLTELNGLPQRATEGSAAYDIVACIDTVQSLSPGEVFLMPTGFAISIKDKRYGAFLIPRSGRGVKDGLVLANTIGLIDSDYQDEVKVALWNRNSDESGKIVQIKPGERVAQMLFAPVAEAQWSVVDQFSTDSDRKGGFGSTG